MAQRSLVRPFSNIDVTSFRFRGLRAPDVQIRTLTNGSFSLQTIDVNRLTSLVRQNPSLSTTLARGLHEPGFLGISGLSRNQRQLLLASLAEGNLRNFISNAPDALPAGARAVSNADLNAALRQLDGPNPVAGYRSVQDSGALNRAWVWVKKHPGTVLVGGLVVVPALVFLGIALDDYIKNNGRRFDIEAISQGDLSHREDDDDSDDDDSDDDDSSNNPLARFDPRKMGPKEKVIDIRFDGGGFTMKERRKVSVVDSNSEPGADGSYTILEGSANLIKVNCCTLTKAGGAQGYVQYSFSFGDAYFGLWRDYAQGVGDTVGQTGGAIGGGLIRGLGDGLFGDGGGFPWLLILVVGVIILLLFFFLR